MKREKKEKNAIWVDTQKENKADIQERGKKMETKSENESEREREKYTGKERQKEKSCRGKIKAEIQKHKRRSI